MNTIELMCGRFSPGIYLIYRCFIQFVRIGFVVCLVFLLRFAWYTGIVSYEHCTRMNIYFLLRYISDFIITMNNF